MILCEPQCSGFEHAEVNSALIAVAHAAYPDAPMYFLAEKEHLRAVRNKLAEQQISTVIYREIKIPARNGSKWMRYPAELALCRAVFAFAADQGISRVTFASITTPGLLAVKLMMMWHRAVRCIIVPHGILEEILPRPLLQSLKKPLLFRTAMVCGNSDRLRFLLLGPSLREQFCTLLPGICPLVRAIDLPYFYREETPPAPFSGEKIRFGYLGVGSREKGAHLLYALAEECRLMGRKYKPEFVLIGPVKEQSISILSSPLVHVPSPDKPLSRDDFDTYAENIHYALYFYSADSYVLRASGAMFDALSFAKPIIALRNPFFQYYFDLMGDIGYLCDSYEEIAERVALILDGGQVERYELQRKNILAGRVRLFPDRLGETFRQVLE